MHRYLCALALVSCGGSSPTPPGEAGPCGSDTFFTGAYVDWDSLDSSSNGFCGIFQAKWTVHDDPARTFTTNPNGRFELCVPSSGFTRVDITPPSVGSECVPGAYAAAGIAVADPTSIVRGATFSARAYTTARRDAFFAAAGLAYDAAKAQIVIHLASPAAVSSSAAHDAAQAFSGTAWTASSTGVDVFLPNVTIPGDGTVSISVAGGRTVSVPVAADTITYVTP